MRLVPFEMPRTVTAALTVPGTNSAGWPRSSGSGSKRFCGPTGIETGSASAFRYPKVASYVVAPFTTQVTKIETSAGVGAGSGVHFVAKSARAVVELDAGGAFASVQVTLLPSGMPATVNADGTVPPARKVVGCPRYGPPGLTLLAGPGSSVTSTGFGL